MIQTLKANVWRSQFELFNFDFESFYNSKGRMKKPNNFLSKINHFPIKKAYKFIKELGRGSSGICYLAQHRQKTDCFRCIKEIKKPLRSNEFQLLQQLTHPNIIRIFQAHENQQYMHIVTEYCEGGDLFEYIQVQGLISESQAKQILNQILSAIKYCHSLKICHRDIKLQNFLVSKSPGSIIRIKLIDFDLAFQWENNMTEEVIAKEGHKVKGTPYYIAPEVFKGKYNEKCDIWSIGILLMIILTGKPPFDGQTRAQILEKIRTQQINFSTPEMKQRSLLVKDLLKKILTGPQNRITIDQIFNHPWMTIEPRKIKFKIDCSYFARFSKFSKLKKIVASYLATQIVNKQLQGLSELFLFLDKNKDGYVSTSQLKEGIDTLQTPIQSKQQFFRLINCAMDQGMLNYSNFIGIFIKQKSLQSQKNLKKVFEMMDFDGNGVIDENQMGKILLKYGFSKKPLNSITVNQENQSIFQKVDKNKDGLIDFEQFKEAIINDFEF